MSKSAEERMNELERVVLGYQERIKDLEAKVKELEDRQNMASGLVGIDDEDLEDMEGPDDDDEDEEEEEEEEDEENDTPSV